MKLDLWDGLSFAGAGLAGGGIWGNWGAPWACIFWGVLLLGLAAAHVWQVAHEKEGA